MGEPADEGSPARDIGIAKPIAQKRSSPNTSLDGLLSWLGVLGLFIALGYLGAPVWLLLTIPVLLIVGAVVWFIIHNGHLTWMRLAQAPARALARGDTVAAERAFAAALARTRGFPPHDYRRGRMLIVLADYLKGLGRFSEAIACYEQAVEALEPHLQSSPMYYFIALNNLSAYFIDVENYADAQRFLETLLVLSLVWTKGGIKADAHASQAVDLVLHLNLVLLFVRLEELPLAAMHLQEADALFRKHARPQKWLADGYRGVRALLLLAQGRDTLAADELSKVQDPENLTCLAARAKLRLARGEFTQAERLLRKYLRLVGKRGSTHRPDVRRQVLDLAECLFGSGKYDEAFCALEEARAITRDFPLPASNSWRKAMAEWLRRAQQLGRITDIAWLEDEVRAASKVPEQTITISPRLRICPPAP
jgi:tetratricopeptide (TPR) repeat protein